MLIQIQIRDIIATATKSQTEYRILTSATVDYLHRLGVPAKLQDRVKLWLSYTWEQQKTLGTINIIYVCITFSTFKFDRFF